MSKKTLKPKPRRGKRAAEKAPASEPFVPEFALADVAEIFGSNYRPTNGPVTPIDLALDALDDLRRGVNLANESLFVLGVNDPLPGAIHDVLTNVYIRAGAAIELLCQVRDRKAGAQ